jgi:hypothetical protein
MKDTFHVAKHRLFEKGMAAPIQDHQMMLVNS